MTLGFLTLQSLILRHHSVNLIDNIFHKVIRNPWPRTTSEAVKASLLGAELRIRINTVEVTLNESLA